MNYLITCAGNGTRFLRQSIKPPKPLIKVFGKELLLWSLESFSFNRGDKLYITYQKEHNLRSRLSQKLALQYPALRIEWLALDDLPNGQLLTALKSLDHFKIDGPLIIHNCDTSFDASTLSHFLDYGQDFGIIPCFEGDGDGWSFVKKVDESSNDVQQVTEKIRISSLCSVGCYAFNSSLTFRQISLDYIEKNPNPEAGEYYIAPIYQHAIEEGFKVKYIPAKNVKLFGTPAQLLSTFNIENFALLSENSWSGHQRGTLVVDVDNTLSVRPNGLGYESCVPITECCEALKRAHQNGIYIILFTARNMRTFNGNLGLINKYTAPTLLAWLDQYSIPYDEVHFGKPWGTGGVEYVDDLNLSLTDFCHK